MATSTIKGNPVLDSGVEIQVVSIQNDVPAYYKTQNYATGGDGAINPYSAIVFGYQFAKIFSAVFADDRYGFSASDNIGGATSELNSVTYTSDGKLKFAQSNRQYIVFLPKRVRLVATTSE